jgi:LDH2 family malate/lactate/ureidoglycolate dehydrogenase
MRRVPVPVLRAAVVRALDPYGMSAEHADQVAENLVSTSLDGIDTHGVRLLATYVKELAGGRANPRPRFAVESRFHAAVLFDADDALGIVAGNAAVDVAVARARKHGAAAVSVRRSNHFGAAGAYATRAAREGMLAFAFSNSDALVSAATGTRALNGTNPIAVALPGFGFDMATSQVSYSRVKQLRAAGEEVPESWARGDVLMPLGGYKGQALGTMVQILCAVIAGMPLDHQLSHLYEGPWDTPRQVAHFFVCVDLRAFGDPEAMELRTSELLGQFDGISAGEKEAVAREERMRLGIPLNDDEWRFFEPYLRSP